MEMQQTHFYCSFKKHLHCTPSCPHHRFTAAGARAPKFMSATAEAVSIVTPGVGGAGGWEVGRDLGGQENSQKCKRVERCFGFGRSFWGLEGGRSGRMRI